MATPVSGAGIENMDKMIDWNTVADCVARATGRAVNIESSRLISGGCINSAAILTGQSHRYFVKFNDFTCLAMFEAEKAGLMELKQADAVRVPEPLGCGVSNDCAFLVMEYLELHPADSDTDARLGKQLARLHRNHAPLFGWNRDNTIGLTPQINSETERWIDFWRNHRLGYQLMLARQNGYGKVLEQKGERLLAGLDRFFSPYNPRPALLHGDLWSGNFAALPDGEPILYDPAVYYGDREADIAMTELFGGFDASFYTAYREDYPLEEGYKARKHLYNLYHVLNHLNLFGSGYRRQVEQLLDVLIGELG
jgi:fructosamine-3-kinase